MTGRKLLQLDDAQFWTRILICYLCSVSTTTGNECVNTTCTRAACGMDGVSPLELQCPDGYKVTGLVKAGFRNTPDDKCSWIEGDCVAFPEYNMHHIVRKMWRQSSVSLSFSFPPAFDSSVNGTCNSSGIKYLIVENFRCVHESLLHEICYAKDPIRALPPKPGQPNPQIISPGFMDTYVGRKIQNQSDCVITVMAESSAYGILFSSIFFDIKETDDEVKIIDLNSNRMWNYTGAEGHMKFNTHRVDLSFTFYDHNSDARNGFALEVSSFLLSTNETEGNATSSTLSTTQDLTTSLAATQGHSDSATGMLSTEKSLENRSLSVGIIVVIVAAIFILLLLLLIMIFCYCCSGNNTTSSYSVSDNHIEPDAYTVEGLVFGGLQTTAFQNGDLKHANGSVSNGGLQNGDLAHKTKRSSLISKGSHKSLPNQTGLQNESSVHSNSDVIKNTPDDDDNVSIYTVSNGQA